MWRKNESKAKSPCGPISAKGPSRVDIEVAGEQGGRFSWRCPEAVTCRKHRRIENARGMKPLPNLECIFC